MYGATAVSARNSAKVKLSERSIFKKTEEIEKDIRGISLQKLPQGESPLWDTNIWPTEKEFLSNFQLPKNGNHFQFSLAIEKVVLPYLHHASKFVDEVFAEFKRII